MITRQQDVPVEVITPDCKSVFQAPPRGGSGNAIFDLEGIAEPEEICVWPGIGLKSLPIPKVVPHYRQISVTKLNGLKF